MSMTNNGGGQGPAEAPTQPQMNVLGQYIKDFSFENPNTPRGTTQPSINVQINVAPRQVSATDFEVVLKIEGKAETQGAVLFAFDLSYAGMFRLQNIPQEHLAPILMIECPRLLFRSPARSSPTPPCRAASRRCFSIRSTSRPCTSSVWRRRLRANRPHRLERSALGRPRTALSPRHSEERSNEAVQPFPLSPGLLRFARNDGRDSHLEGVCLNPRRRRVCRWPAQRNRSRWRPRPAFARKPGGRRAPHR